MVLVFVKIILKKRNLISFDERCKKKRGEKASMNGQNPTHRR